MFSITLIRLYLPMCGHFRTIPDRLSERDLNGLPFGGSGSVHGDGEGRSPGRYNDPRRMSTEGRAKERGKEREREGGGGQAASGSEEVETARTGADPLLLPTSAR